MISWRTRGQGGDTWGLAWIDRTAKARKPAQMRAVRMLVAVLVMVVSLRRN
jgi:hypothetical protein